MLSWFIPDVHSPNLWQLFMEQDQFCNILCMEHFKSHDVQAFKAIIKEEYHHNWIIDNLPVHFFYESVFLRMIAPV